MSLSINDQIHELHNEAKEITDKMKVLELNESVREYIEYQFARQKIFNKMDCLIGELPK